MVMLPDVTAAAPLLLWEVSGGGTTVWLYGSVHLCRADCYPLPREVDRRFEAAELLAVELDVTRPEVATTMSRSTRKTSAPLSRLLSPDEWAALQKEVLPLGVKPSHLDQLSPQLAVMMLSLAEADRMGLSPRFGVDLQFIDRAQRSGKPLVELETVERQLAAMTAGTDADALLALKAAMSSVSDGSLRTMLEDLVGAWRRGDASRLADLLKEAVAIEGGDRATFGAVFDQRNREMSERIGKLARGSRAAFVVVGSGHLAGREAIPELLTRQGLKVRRLSSGEDL